MQDVFSARVSDYLNLCFVKNHEEGVSKHRHECSEAHVGATVVCRRALVTWEAGMVMSPEKYVLLRAKVLEMNSKSLEVDNAEEHRLLRGGGGTGCSAGPCATECSPRGSSHSSGC